MAAELVVSTKDLPDEEHQEEEQEADGGDCPVDEHAGRTLTPARWIVNARPIESSKDFKKRGGCLPRGRRRRFGSPPKSVKKSRTTGKPPNPQRKMRKVSACSASS